MKKESSLNRESRARKNSTKIAAAMTGIVPGACIQRLARKAGRPGKNEEGRKKIPQSAIYGISGHIKNRKSINKLVLKSSGWDV